MIAHIVLFEPRADVSAATREQLARSFERAVSSIPQVRRARIGERRILGRFYDRHNAHDYSYCAIIEFDTEADLVAYLDHPAHEELGALFYQSSEAALAYDFDLLEGENAQRLFARGSSAE